MQLYPQLPRAHCPPQLPIAPIGSGGHPDDHALSNQGILPSAPVHAVFQCPESGGLRFEVNHFGQDQRHRDQYAPHTSYGPASRSAIQAVHSQQRDIAWSASSMVHCPPRQQHEELDEVATPASEHYDLSSDFEHVSIPHALPPQHFKELDQYVGLLQRGAYSQPPASGVAETEPSRLEQAPVRHGIREETHHLTESAEQKDSSIQHAEARRDSSNIPEKTPKSCFPFWSKKFKGIRRMAKRFFCL
ncbi:uncharacterized protein LOC119401549 isoform X2 [Rhipicephalus sanguineus]|uniref:uncharacterized protein LOC119401549 isoform X2 n=1 Tax=Rhipicephalus sanguineus TaxID=34632 RepID=UPI0020C2D893|nr:uncharacterized protein LOC119401549 isoform X2 [Rhipicephalus sanguineus]